MSCHWRYRLTVLIITKARVSRHEELKALLEEFREPPVRTEQMRILRDGLEGKSACPDGIKFEIQHYPPHSASKRETICSWISDLPYTRYHRTASAGRGQGTCHWLLQTAQFQAWQRTSASSILWLRGDRKFMHLPVRVISISI